jgi:vitamin B12 transporter
MQKSFIVLCALLFTAAPLWAEVVRLDPVVVTASRTAQSISEVPASITIITEEEIINSGSTTIAEVLQHEVGMQVVNNGSLGSVASLSIRGSEAAQVLVLIDGIRMNSAQNGQFDLSQLPIALEQIERIEILRGPASNVYGANALGGVVQIITKKPTDQPLTSLSWKESRWNTRQLSLTTAQKINAFSFRLGVSDDSSDGYRDNSALDQNRYDASIGIDLPRDFNLEVSASYLDKEAGVPGATSYPSLNAYQTDRNSFATVTFQGPAGNSNLKIQGIYQRKHNNYVDPDSWVPTDDTHIIKSKTLLIQDDFTLGSNQLLVGGEFSKNELKSTTAGNRNQKQSALFGEFSRWITSSFKTTLGLRYDNPSNFDSQISPRLAMLLKLSSSTNLRGSVAKAFRAPTLNDLYWPETAYAKGNPDLDPETALEYELAVDHNFNKKDRLSMSIFLREVEDLINWAPDSSYVWKPTNLNDAEIYGTEISATYVPIELATLTGNYTYLHAVNETTDEFIDTKPRHQFNASIDLGPWAKTNLRVQGKYVKYYNKPSRKTNSYTTVDLVLKRPFALKYFDLEGSLGVKNLFDRDYEVNEGYPMPGRALFANLTALF